MSGVAVKQSLSKAGIAKALIIDDAYDPPTRTSLADRLASFWDRVERSPDALKELQDLDPSIEDESALTDPVLEKLWERKDSLPHLNGALKEVLFGPKLDDQRQLKYLSDSLKDLGIEAICLRSDEDAPPEDVKLIFIDYFLGGAGTEGVANSKVRARELYDRTPQERPFIVLMSSKADETSAEMFRETSGFVRGLFGWLSKREFQKKEVLYFHLASWAFAMPTRHEIQHFAETLVAALPKVTEDFTRYVRSLGFEDYANIQAFCLQEEGQPLGEYMLWLYKSLLGYLLQSQPAVRDLQHKLDQMEFNAFTPNQTTPSLELADIYSFAITEPNVPPIGPHPRERAATAAKPAHIENVPGAAAAGIGRTVGAHESGAASVGPDAGPAGTSVASNLPSLEKSGEEVRIEGKEQKTKEPTFVPLFFSLGDLLFKDGGSEVLAVINGACDLAFAPNTKRKVPPQRSVLFLHGMLERYDQGPGSAGTRTELLRHDGHAYRIAWSRDEVTSVPYCEVHEWLLKNRFERRARLSLPYALQIQQAFTSSTMRIGMPVRPPIYRHVSVTIYGIDVEGNYKEHSTIVAGAVIISRRRETEPDEEKFVLTLTFVLSVVAVIEDVEAGFALRKAELERKKNEAEAVAQAQAQAETDKDAVKVSEAEAVGPKIQKAKESLESIAAKAAKGKFDEIKKRMGGFSKLKAAAEMWEQSMRRPMDIPLEGKAKNLGDDLAFVSQSPPSGEFKGPGLVALRVHVETLAEKETKDAVAVAAAVALIKAEMVGTDASPAADAGPDAERK